MIDLKKIKELDEESTVCFLSADLQFLIRGLKKKLKKHPMYRALYEEDLNLISSKVRTVQRKAQRMEKRLKKYRSAIESLGFNRTR